MSRADAHADASSSVYPGFASPSVVPTGYLPTGAVAADFDGDGKMDLAIANGGDNSVYVLLGKGDGSFAVPEVLYTAGASPVAIVAARLRTGGHLDLAVVDADTNQVEVFSGKGDGSFAAPVTVATLDRTATAIVAADFNKDGKIDLAASLTIDPLSAQPPFIVLLGDGGGSFPASVQADPVFNSNEDPLPPYSLLSADLNGDGYPDVVVSFLLDSAISFASRSGKGYTAVSSFATEDGQLGVALGDVTGDGCVDAVQGGEAGLLTVANGACDASFPDPLESLSLGDTDATISLADVDGDGHLDVIGAGAFFDLGADLASGGTLGGYLISVARGDGKGNFAPAEIYRGSADNFTIVTADFTGDDRPEILTLSQAESNARLLINDGHGHFGAPSGEAIGYVKGIINSPVPLAEPQVADVNGDGKPDVVLIESGVSRADPDQLTTLVNDGTGKFLAPLRSPITVGPPDNVSLCFAVGVFRTGQTADVIYITTIAEPPLTVSLLPGAGDGSFGAPIPLGSLEDPLLVTTGDFNKDGKLDFAVYGGSLSDASVAEIDVFLGDGKGGFRHLPTASYSLPATLTPAQIFAGDFNHDGSLDLLIGLNANGGLGRNGSDLLLVAGNGDGTFQAPTILMTDFGPVAVGDLNHDGYLDLVQSLDATNDAASQALNGMPDQLDSNAPTATVYLGKPGGGYTQTTYNVPGVQVPSLLPALLGDFNGDGNLDVAVTYGSEIGIPGNRRLAIFQGLGDGTLAANAIPYSLPKYDNPIVGGDFRGNGRTDLLDLVGITPSVHTVSAGTPAPFAIVIDASPLTGSSGTATLLLAEPAKAGEIVALKASDPAVSLPASVSLNQGDLQQTFSYSLGSSFDKTHMLAITAGKNGFETTAYSTYSNPNLSPSAYPSINIKLYQGPQPFAVSPGTSIALLFNLQSIDGYSGFFPQLSCTGLPPGAACKFEQSSMRLFPGSSAVAPFEVTTSDSTPLGTYNVQVVASNGSVTAAAPMTFGVGGFSLSVNPAVLTSTQYSAPSTLVTVNYLNGYSNEVTLSCSGLPASAGCQADGPAYPGAVVEGVSIQLGSTAPPIGDYPFTITGNAGSLSAAVSAVLRISGFTAALDHSSATLAPGATSTFNVTLSSQNHFTNSSIELSCSTSTLATCAATPGYASLTDGGTTVVMLAVSAATTTARQQAPPSASSPYPYFSKAAPLLALLVLPLARSRRTWRNSLLALSAAATISYIAACGGSSAPPGIGGGTGGTGGTGGGGGGQTATIQVYASAEVNGMNQQVSAGTITLNVTH